MYFGKLLIWVQFKLRRNSLLWRHITIDIYFFAFKMDLFKIWMNYTIKLMVKFEEVCYVRDNFYRIEWFTIDNLTLSQSVSHNSTSSTPINHWKSRWVNVAGSAGVAPEVNLRNPLHAVNEASKRGYLPWLQDPVLNRGIDDPRKKDLTCYLCLTGNMVAFGLTRGCRFKYFWNTIFLIWVKLKCLS